MMSLLNLLVASAKEMNISCFDLNWTRPLWDLAKNHFSGTVTRYSARSTAA